MSTLNVNKIADASGGVLAPISSVMRNRIINGAMVIDQRNAGAAINSAGNASFGVDRFNYATNQSGKFNIQQNAGSITPQQDLQIILGFTSTSAFSAAAGDFFWLDQRIEGFNTADLGWGTANAATVTLSFWVRSSLTGTHSGALQNSSSAQSYVFTYTISSANTWEYKTITIAGNTTGTWLTNNGIGIFVSFNLGSGTNWQTSTVNAWQTAQEYAATGAVSVVGTSGATFYITGVQLEKGTQATGFEYRQYGQELALCQRYFEAGSLWREGTNSTSGNFCVFSESFLVQKRASATFTYGNVGGSNSNISSIQGTEAIYEWLSPYDQTNARTGFAFRFIPSNATSTIRQYWTASAEL